MSYTIGLPVFIGLVGYAIVGRIPWLVPAAWFAFMVFELVLWCGVDKYGKWSLKNLLAGVRITK